MSLGGDVERLEDVPAQVHQRRRRVDQPDQPEQE